MSMLRSVARVFVTSALEATASAGARPDESASAALKRIFVVRTRFLGLVIAANLTAVILVVVIASSLAVGWWLLGLVGMGAAVALLSSRVRQPHARFTATQYCPYNSPGPDRASADDGDE
jgi:hypothetical protein